MVRCTTTRVEWKPSISLYGVAEFIGQLLKCAARGAEGRSSMDWKPCHVGGWNFINLLWLWVPLELLGRTEPTEQEGTARGKNKGGGQLGLQTNFAVSFIPLAEWHHICIRDDRKFTKRTVKVFTVLITEYHLILKKREYWEFVSLGLLNPFRHVSFFQLLVIVIRELKASGHFSQFSKKRKMKLKKKKKSLTF